MWVDLPVIYLDINFVMHKGHTVIISPFESDHISISI